MDKAKMVNIKLINSIIYFSFIIALILKCLIFKTKITDFQRIYNLTPILYLKIEMDSSKK